VGILAFSNTLPLFLLTAVILGIGHAFLIPILMMYALERGGSSPGPVMGTFHGLLDLGQGLGPIMMGMILHATSYRVMFLSLMLIGLMNLGYFYCFVRKRG
jgi:MFS family permease